MPHPPAAACAAIYVYVATPAQQSPLYLLFPVLVGCAYLVWVQSGIAMYRRLTSPPAEPPLIGKPITPAEKPVAPESIEPEDEKPVALETNEPEDEKPVAPETTETKDEIQKPVAPETKPKDKKPLKARVASPRPMPTMPKLSKKYIEFKSKFKSTAARVGSFRAQGGPSMV